MALRRIRALILVGAAGLALSGCGGGGGSGIASTPPAPATPTPTPTPAQSQAIVPAATTSQQFAAFGSSHLNQNDQGPRLDSSSQLQVRYVQSTNTYEVQVPNGQSWTTLSYVGGGPGTGAPVSYGSPSAFVWLRSDGYQYSRLLEWASTNTIYGEEAIGIATPTGGVPVTGTASYGGELLGLTNEQHDPSDMWIGGTIALNFNFGTGGLTGSISPVVHQDFASFPVGTINIADPVFSIGSTTFSGKFDTALSGINSFRGLFTGPSAQEMIGNFAVPYRSPIDGQNYQADGAFIGKR